MSKHSTKHTFSFKTEPVNILCDVHLPDETKFGLVAHLSRQIMAQASGKQAVEEDHKLPVLVFWHGGGLTSGHREAWKPNWLFEDALNAGFIVVSADYRLLSPSTGHAVLEDAVDLIKWIHSDLNDHLARVSSALADLDRVAVSGSSAGGYIAYLASLHAKPTPKALAGIYPLAGDLLLDHWCMPKTEPWYQDRPLFTSDDPWRPLLATPKDAIVTTSGTESATSPRVDYVFWLMEKGQFLDVLTGEVGLGKKLREVSYEQRAKSISASAKVLFPQFALAETTSFPPTIIVHGTEDGAVPLDETRNAQRLLTKQGVEVEVLVFQGRDHAFDLGTDVTKEEREKLGQVVPFLLRHLKK